MSYQVLARKWRPKNFEELMGQEHVVSVLVNALSQQRLHHAYLFTGTRGVGKTTIARIFAKSLNCETGITAKPCGKCDTCLDIDQGRFIDLLEIDAASKTKVDDTREILDNVQYAPTRGRYKVYLIDEVHMLSRHSFNALLKTLEEPPEHVKFILATTDPQKLPITVLSRCLQFHLKALTVKQIEAKLAEILEQESVTHQAGTLTMLAKAARGSMRDSLSLTDQAIAQGQGDITLANLQQMLGGLDQNWVYKILIALLKQDGVALMSLSQEIASYGPNYNRLFAELIQLFHQIAIRQIVDQNFDLSPEHVLLLKKFSEAMSAEDIQLYYQISVNGRKDLPYAADEQAAFDMTILRLLAFKPMQATDTPHLSQNPTQHSTQDTETLVTFDFDEVILAETEISKPDEIKTVESQTDKIKADKVKAADTESEVTEKALEEKALEEKFIRTGDEQTALAQEMFAIEAQAVQQVATQAISSDSSTTIIEEKPVESVSSSINTVPLERLPVVDKISSTVEDLDPVSAILATRNMLRSRKKELDKTAKKSDDASERQVETQINNQNESPTVNAEAKEQKTISAPKEPYHSDNIDPSVISKANQVDKWAHMIDAMELTARIRQLAIHATIAEESSDEHLILRLDQATKHLQTDAAHQQLQQQLSQFLSKEIKVTIEVVEKTISDPYQIQSHINDKRYDYAKELLQKDEIVSALQNKFQATLDENTIVAR